LKKFRGKGWKDIPLVEKFLFGGTFSFFIYIFLDLFIYLLAPISMEMAPLGLYKIYNDQFTLYNIQYTSLFLVNLLRDIATLGAMVQLWSYFLASLTILLGESRSLKLSKNILFLLLISTISIFIAFNDTITVTIIAFNDTITGPVVKADFSGIGLFVMYLYVSIYFFSVVMLFLSLRREKRVLNINSNQMKIHVKSLILGIFLMGLGYFYWIVLSSPMVKIPSFFFENNLYFYVGHSIWTISPIFIYFGLRKPIEISPKIDEDYSEIGKKNFKKLVETEILGMYLIKGDKIIYSNSMMQKSLKFNKKELVKWSVTRLLEQVYPEDFVEVKEYYVKKKNGGFHEFRFLSKENEIVWVRQIMYPNLEYDEPVFQYIFEDITETKKIEAEKKILQGMLPICAKCKKIRDDKGYYVQIEKYIQDHSNAMFTHGLCDDCMTELGYTDFPDED
jgi:PAS domain S-box-containing protein